MLTIEQARDLALEWHQETKYFAKKEPEYPTAGYYYTGEPQRDKNGRPYIEHLDAVALGTQVFTTDEEVIAAALLHDIVEDTDMTFAELLREGASRRQVKIVRALTKTAGEVQANYLNRVIAAGEDAMRVKLADLLHNTRPDRLAELPVYTRERLLKKYQPSIARFMQELGYIVTVEEFQKVPVGSSTTTTGTGTSYDSNAIKQWAFRQPPWVTKGDEVKLEGEIHKVMEANMVSGDRRKFVFDNGDDFECSNSIQIECRATSASQYGTNLGNATKSKDKPSNLNWQTKVANFFSVGDFIKMAGKDNTVNGGVKEEDYPAQISNKIHLTDGKLKFVLDGGAVIELEKEAKLQWKPKQVSSPVSTTATSSGGSAGTSGSGYPWAKKKTDEKAEKDKKAFDDAAKDMRDSAEKSSLQTVLEDDSVWDNATQ